jgi:hypothetical protein
VDELTIEVIDRFLEGRGWRRDGEYCWRDPERHLAGSVHWTNALEVQFRRDHRSAAGEMARGFGALATSGASR